jgi:hypothetical protein
MEAALNAQKFSPSVAFMTAPISKTMRHAIPIVMVLVMLIYEAVLAEMLIGIRLIVV